MAERTERIIKTEKNWAVLDHLPKIPESILHEELNNQKYSLKRHRPQIPSFDGFNRKDGRTQSPEIKAYEVGDTINNWVCNNISPTNRGLLLRQVMVDEQKNFYPPHTDVNRQFVVLYNIVDSGGEFVFWRERGYDDNRGMLSRLLLKDYDQLEEIERFIPPVNCWYIINSAVIHSVENLSGTRINFQFNAEYWDPIVNENLILQNV